jgi:hypothetical protein
MKSTLKSFNESESRLPSLAKSSANGLDLTLSATKTASPLVLIQSDSSASDNTANAKNTNLKTIINNKLAALNLSGYNAKMIMNRAEAMSCGGCDPSSLRVAKA